MNKKYISLLAGAGLIASLALVLPAFAQAQVGVNVGARVGFRGGPGQAVPPGIFGTVTAIDGTTLSVTANNRMMMRPGEASSSVSGAATTTVYTVDASNATIYKDSTSTTSTITSISIGDMVMVQGTVSGTSVTATVIRDGLMRPGMAGGGKGFGGHSSSSTWASSTPPFTGNGEPVVAGNITAVSGTTITITNASNVTYTIDAASSTIVKNGTSTAITNLMTGDSIVVQGTVDGTSVTASSIIDQGQSTGGHASSSASSHQGGVPFVGGFLGAIGGFFKHLFGF